MRLIQRTALVLALSLLVGLVDTPEQGEKDMAPAPGFTLMDPVIPVTVLVVTLVFTLVVSVVLVLEFAAARA